MYGYENLGFNIVVEKYIQSLMLVCARILGHSGTLYVRFSED
jgi:hypothetical protein